MTYKKHNQVLSTKYSSIHVFFVLFLFYSFSFFRESAVHRIFFYQNHLHNHTKNCALTLKYKRIQPEIRKKFLIMFERLNPQKAYSEQMNDLKNEYGEDFHLVKGNGSVCPKKKWVYNLYYHVFKKEYGQNHGEAMMTSLSSKIDDYNKKCNETCAVLERN